ncbi:hypothetical protein GCM10028794_10400 [Silanimonas algicola]
MSSSDAVRDGTERPLEVQRAEFAAQRGLAMPLAGTIAWAVVGISGLFLPESTLLLVLVVATGMIAYIGMGLSKLTGEDFLDKTKPKNVFLGLFFVGMAQALLAYAIAIPFGIADPSAMPLGVAVLSVSMWMVYSWIIGHWIGYAHAATRVVAVLSLHYALPEHRYVAIPAAVVVLYLAVMVVQERRWRASQVR